MLTEVNKKFDFRKVCNPLVFKINPNNVTLLALIVAILAGYSFYKGQLVIAALLVFLNGFLDVLDGQIAKKFGTSKFGDFLDHTFDRIADTAIFLGISFSPFVPTYLGLITLVSILLVSYLGTQAQALTKKRAYGGVLGRADRIIIITATSLITVYYSQGLYYGMVILFLLSVFTFVQRFYSLSKNLR